VLTAQELHERGVAAINAGRLRPARRLLERAQERATGEELVGAIEASMAYVEAETGNRAEAMLLCERALTRPGLAPDVRGSIHSQHGLLLMLAGRLPEAMAELETAIDQLVGAPRALGRAHGNRGNLFLQQNDLAGAERDFEAAYRLLRTEGLAVEAAMNEHNLGYTRFLAGDLAQALRDMDSARVVLAPLSPVAEATCDQDRAEVLMAAGLVEEGRRALAGAARAYGSRRLRRRQAEAELALARTLMDDDPADSLAFARRARRHFLASDAEAWRVRADAVALAAEVELGRAGPSLLTRGHDLAGELEAQELHWGAVAVLLRANRVRLRRGDLDDATAALTGIRVDDRAPLAVRLLYRDVRADLAARRGRRAEAFRHVRSGLGELHAWQSSFGSLDLQTNVVGHGRRLGVRALELAADSRRPEVLFEWSERARMLASRVQPVRAPQDESIVADLAELREMARANEGAGRRSPEREAELRQRVRERAWHHRGSGEVADPVSLGQLRDGLGADTALVAYVVTGNRVVALVVTQASTTQLDLGERRPLDELLDGLVPDLDMAASELPDSLAVVVRRQLGQRLDGLAKVLVSPVLDAVGDRQVVLTPSGVLATVPWPLLSGYVGRPVTVAQSATSWLARRTTPLRAGSAGFVAGPRVDRAEDEVLAAARRWPDARVLAGGAATADAVSELAAGVDVLHVAAHGRHSAENPMFSGVELADGPWFGYDIDQLRAVPDVVLLSACEVGGSSVRWGEELIGMTAAWLHAGVRRVVASAAAVNDAAACDALVRVHERLAAGADPAVALADAVPAAGADAPPVPLVCFG
jgi:tetratricopeptide (TPR) repeat protein